jgi:beta-phosphoglucomutase
MRAFDAVLFDFDGVLVDSEPVHYGCWREIAERYGIALDWDTYNRVGRGFSEEEMVRAFCALRDPPLPFETLWAEYPRKKRMFVERSLAIGLVQAPVRELLAGLKDEGYRLALVTSSSRAEVEPILTAGGVAPLLDAFVSAESVTEKKPAAEPYRKAAALLGARHPLVAEDTDVGEASGRAAGFAVVRIAEQARMPEIVRDRLAGAGA